MDARKEAEYIMRMLVKALKTQKAVAKVLGQSKQTFNYWFNHANKVPFDQLLKMQKLLSKHQKLDPSISETNDPKEASVFQIHPVFISQQVAHAITLEKSLGKRKGTRTDLKNRLNVGEISLKNAQRRSNCAQVKGKTTSVVAKQAGFKSRDTYLRAKKVVLTGTPQLIQAMDEKRVTIFQAAQLAGLDPHTQVELLTQSKKQITTHLKKKKTKLPLQPSSGLQLLDLIGSVTHALHQQANSLPAKQRDHLILRATLIGLIAGCDECGKFSWQPNKLRDVILPGMELDFSLLLDALCRCGLIQKNKNGDQTYGFIPLIEQCLSEVAHATMVA